MFFSLIHKVKLKDLILTLCPCSSNYGITRIFPGLRIKVKFKYEEVKIVMQSMLSNYLDII
jgi:hypothetical protein